MTTVSCISCDLNAFQVASLSDGQSLLNWLENLPGLNYQCKDRARAVFSEMEKRAISSFDAIKHCFLAAGVVMGVNKEIRTESRDVYICWVHSSGKMYAIDADNRSEELCAAFHQPPRAYVGRWISSELPRVIELQSKTLSYTQVHDVIREFTTPDQIEYCASLKSHCFYANGPCVYCLQRTVTDDLTKLFSEPPQADKPIVATVAIPEPSAGPVITSVEVKMRPTNISEQPNRADVCLRSNGTHITVDANKVMHIIDAYTVLNANPTNSPAPTSLVFTHFDATIEFFASPRMLQELARLRIWREHYLASEFRVQPGNEDLSITVIREE